MIRCLLLCFRFLSVVDKWHFKFKEVCKISAWIQLWFFKGFNLRSSCGRRYFINTSIFLATPRVCPTKPHPFADLNCASDTWNSCEEMAVVVTCCYSSVQLVDSNGSAHNQPGLQQSYAIKSIRDPRVYLTQVKWHNCISYFIPLEFITTLAHKKKKQ